MNKQSNTYTIIYIIILVVVVGAALAFTSISLKDRQQANADADKMRQILASVRVEVPQSEIATTYSKYITRTMVIDSAGHDVSGATSAFDINIAAEVKEPADKRELPIYKCTLPDGEVKYILPMYGNGLWGPIWGYISVDSNGSTVYGAYFAHQGETPGLGAEIEQPYFRKRFEGKQLMINGSFAPIEVVKPGMPAPSDADYVDGISGGTITSKGVGAMIDNSLAPYAAFLKGLQN